MNRREWMMALIGFIVTPLAARAQQVNRTYRLGYLSQPSRVSVEGVLRAFVAKLRTLGWEETASQPDQFDRLI